MTKEVESKLKYVHSVLEEARVYQDAVAVLGFDLETICPPKAMEAQGEISAELSNKAYKLMKQKRFIEAVEYLYKHRRQLDEYDEVVIRKLYEGISKTRKITPAMQRRYSTIYNKAYVDWLNAKQQSDFSIFAPSLEAVVKIEKEQVALREKKKPVLYDNFIGEYEEGMTSSTLDEIFGESAERMVPLLEKIKKSKKKIRRDFLSIPVTDEQQAKMARYLLELEGFDFERGALSTTEHPFTSKLGRDDIRVTTHYHENAFLSSMYSVLHEGGHALFDMFSPAANDDHHLDNKCMGQHESVSRFYENRIGRSKAFIELIYDRTREIFPQVMEGVTKKQLYEAANIVEPSLIRTEADEFTYLFHIIIRYEMEKQILSGKVKLEDMPERWNALYEKYLGIRPGDDAQGILQDVHWTFGFGYFPTYALGNYYNAMYYNTMNREIKVDKLVKAGKLLEVRDWMQAKVFARADLLTPEEWLVEITGRSLTADDFLDYLEEKFGEIYGL